MLGTCSAQARTRPAPFSQAAPNNTAQQIDKVIKQYVDHQVFSGAVLVAKSGTVDLYPSHFKLQDKTFENCH
jgi:hypothetical protein